MKRSIVQRMAFCSAVAWLAAAAGTSSAQHLGRGEYVVDSQVISDTAVESDGIVEGDEYVSDTAVESDGIVEGGEYVGDMSVGFAGGVAAMRRGFGQPDLFYNYYTQGQANRANAQMFLSPLPVPPNVGHTFFTYQPFYPDELLYWHKNRYHNYYDNGRGMNRTRAVYYSPPIRQAASNFYWNVLRIPR